MKNLKKISRNQLKTVKGGGCGPHLLNLDDPRPTNCGCNLVYCENMGACVDRSYFTRERCKSL